MSWQLILRRECQSGTEEELFLPCRRYDVQSLPFTLPHEADGELSLPTELQLRLEADDAQKNGACALLWNGQAGITVRLNDSAEAASSPLKLRNGACVYIGDKWQLRYYQIHGRPGICGSANALGTLARCGIVLVLLAQLFAIVGMPILLYYTGVFKNESQRQELSYRTDQTRKRLNKIESHEPVMSAYLELLRTELNDRVRFLRRNGASIAPEEQQAMLDNLTRLDSLIDRLQKSPSKDAAPQIDLKLDDGVQRVIGNRE
jgi:hypothetical protein